MRPAASRWLQRIAFVVFFRPLLRIAARLQVRGIEHLPRTGPFLIVSNHVSHLDTLALLGLFRGTRLASVRPVAAEDYWDRHPALWWAGRTLFNILPIARERPTRAQDPLVRMLDALRRGETLIMFPEGTRGHGASLAPFKPGVAHVIAAMPGLPVVPAWMENTGRCLPKGAIVPRPTACEIRLGCVIFPQGSRDQILRALEDAVRELGARRGDAGSAARLVE